MAKLDIECCPICCAPVKVIETCNSVRFEYDGPRWISVEERLPEELMDVLVYRDGCFAIARIIAGEDWTYSGIGGDPTHWMPLPPMLKEEAK